MIERITSETGGQKDKKRAQLGALDPKALLTLAEVAGFGAEKYDRYNMLKGYDWSLCFDAMQRHLLAFWAGEDVDPESGLPHVAHAAWHALTLLAFQQRGVGTDDRPPVAQPKQTGAVGPTTTGVLGYSVRVGSPARLCGRAARGDRHDQHEWDDEMLEPRFCRGYL